MNGYVVSTHGNVPAAYRRFFDPAPRWRRMAAAAIGAAAGALALLGWLIA